MTGAGTLGSLFEVAMAVEEKAKVFYEALSKKFSHMPGIAKFWNGMAEDEVRHARILTAIRGLIAPEQLLLPADPDMLWKADKAFGSLSVDRTDFIKTLDEAYESAHEVENSEINAIFIFLRMKCVSPGAKEYMAHTVIERHLDKLMNFPSRFGNAEQRKGITALGR